MVTRRRINNPADDPVWKVWQRTESGCTAVQAAREFRHMTVADLSAQCGISTEQISAFENRKAVPSEAEARMIARACAVPVDLFIQ